MLRGRGFSMGHNLESKQSSKMGGRSRQEHPIIPGVESAPVGSRPTGNQLPQGPERSPAERERSGFLLQRTTAALTEKFVSGIDIGSATGKASRNGG